MSWNALFRENRGQKLFALGLAVLIWFTVRSTEGLRLVEDESHATRRFESVSITVLTSASDLGRYQVSPESVMVELRGNPAVLNQLAPRELEVYVNLIDLGTTPQDFPLHVNPPPGTDLVAVRPLKVLVDRLPEVNPAK
jgi:YbbR domain-containing protein